MMSYEAIDDTGRVVTLRKPSRCEWCDAVMQPGEKAVTRAYKIDGDFMCARMHPECYAAMEQYFNINRLEQEFEGGCMDRGKARRWDEEPIAQ